ITKYIYDSPVSESVNEIRIYPLQGNDQEILQQDLIITGDPEIQLYTDYWGNKTGFFNVLESHHELKIESRVIVRTTQEHVGEIGDGMLEELVPLVDNSMLLQELKSPDAIRKQPLIDAICKELLTEGKTVLQIIQDCSSYIFHQFKYTKGITNIETTVDEILEHQGGVCQDFAHLLLQLLRTMGIPCRYVSGYICPNKNGMRGEGATHAWVEVFIPGASWRGIDPTNDVWVSSNHVKLAVGRNFKDCSPVKGTFKGSSRQQLYVFVSVGYEDGQVFEETTQVQMEKIDPVVEEKRLAAIEAAQQ
ncbi:MAG: hypothetical protein RL394_215, partial [Bacteroidota bacterium]